MHETVIYSVVKKNMAVILLRNNLCEHIFEVVDIHVHDEEILFS